MHKGFGNDGCTVVYGGAIRGRYIVDGKRQDHKMKTAGLTEQRLEVRSDEKTNTLTTVQKDNVVVFRDKSQTILATIYKENAKSMVKRNKMGLVVGATAHAPKVVVYRPCERIKEGSVGHVANATDIKGMECIKRVYGQDGKAPTLTTMGGGHREPKVSTSEITYRKLTPIECERLQTFPDNWTDCISNTQRYKSLGNAWTVDVIAHILQCGFKS